MQHLAHLRGDLLARQQEELVGILAEGSGLLHVQREAEGVAKLLVQDELRLELPALDGVHAHRDIGSVVHPPPAAVVVVVIGDVAFWYCC